jgi:hypothetical protein
LIKNGLAVNLIFIPVFEWLKQVGQPFENQTQIMFSLSPFEYWTSPVFEGSLHND